MRKLVIFLCSTFYILHSAFAQNPGEWMWIRGDSAVNNPGFFGTKGVPSPSNDPPALYEACEWTDLNGNFWLFGGSKPGTWTNDLWRYNPVTNQWTWMTGSNSPSDQGNYGTMGVPSPTNSPPNRRATLSWTDHNNNLWMFGGNGLPGNILSDLWKYDISTNMWTWMKGPKGSGNPSVYGTMGMPDTANHPGGRCETAVAWTDNAGDLWFFGGYSSGVFNGVNNDLWRYHIATNTWTWMKGSQVTFPAGVYGTLGIEAPANTPGGRSAYSRWKDSGGNLWLFGGGDFASANHNDLWRYNPVTNNWTWMAGSNLPNASGIYGTRCIGSTANIAGQRMENRASWTDDCGNFWMFGGSGVGLGPPFGNDLWMYCVASQKWTWSSGDTVNGIGSWGMLGVSSPTNKPNPSMGALAWSDHQGHLYLFGGTDNPYNLFHNGVWKYTIDLNCGNCSCSQALPVASFQSSDSAFCDEAGKCIDFIDHSTGNPTSWKWLFPGAIPDSSVQKNPTNICYYAPGTYAVTLIVTNAAGTDTLAVSPMITFGQTLPAPTISIHAGDTLICSHASYYQWFFNGNPIPTATDSFYVATNDGNYNVQITDSLGCSRLGNGILFVGVHEFGEQGKGIWVYPNPARSELSVMCAGCRGKEAMVEIYNVLGEKVLSQQQETRNTKHETIIDVSVLSKGIYVVLVRDGERVYRSKFIKE